MGNSKKYKKNLKKYKKYLKKKIASCNGKYTVEVIKEDIISTIYSYDVGHEYSYISLNFVKVSCGFYNVTDYNRSVKHDVTYKRVSDIAFDLKKFLYERHQNDKKSI